MASSSIRYFDNFESVHMYPQKVISSRLSFKVSKVLGAEFVVTFSSRFQTVMKKSSYDTFFRSKRNIG